MRITRLLAMLLSAGLLYALPMSAQCGVRRLSIGRDFGSTVFVSVPPRDFTVNKLICLAHSLRVRHAQGRFNVLFFGSHEAAEQFQPPLEDVYREEFGSQLHATYSFDPKQGETLDISPMGFGTPTPLLTTLTLPLKTTAHCNLQLRERCLIVAPQIQYPVEALTKGRSGRITLTATIKPDGEAKKIRVLEADVNPGEGENVLANAAIRNLESWQFDAGATDEIIQITFSYVIDTSLAPGIGTDVQWTLPKGVTIRGRP